MRIDMVLRAAANGLRANLLRSVLTSLGVIIGIASVVVVASVTLGTQREIEQLVSSLGANRVDIKSGSRSGAVNAKLMLGGLFQLHESDASAIAKRVPDVVNVASSIRGTGHVVARSKSWTTTWQGVDGDFLRVNSYDIAKGRSFDSIGVRGNAYVVILGDTVRKRLFGSKIGINERVRIAGTNFVVIGVLNARGQSGFGQDMDDTILVPIEVARRKLMGDFPVPRKAVQQISVTIADGASLERVQSRIGAVLRAAHRISPGDPDDFSVGNVADAVAARAQSTRMMRMLLAMVAGVCLLVGGIGIMNMMLVSVSERCSEIGLRLAVGASHEDIRLQFLSEAALLSIFGGVVGLGLGVIASLSIDVLQLQTVSISPGVCLIAMVFSVATGILFGYIPAHRASQLDPIRALRSA